MNTDKLFSKLGISDYNNQLETILEDKDFSVGVKNLLLSMLYKIESAYKDYSLVKRTIESKKSYIEEILDIIKNKCKKIIIVEQNSEEAKELEEKKSKFLVDKLTGTIFLMYPNETLLLYTIYKLDDKQVYLDEKYNLIRIALSSILNSGEDINNIEVLRDFNGWNWNIQVKEIPEITTNLVYQNLIYLLGIDFIKKWVHTEEVVDYIELTEKNLSKLYGKDNSKDILRKLYKISIIICIEKNEREKKRLLEEKETIEAELNMLKDKVVLLNEIAKIKKASLKRIKEIDNILNDKKLLEEEYIKTNEKRPMYNKLFNINHLIEILNKERKKQLQIIEDKNKLLEPNNYIKETNKLENQLEILEVLDLSLKEQEAIKYNCIINLQRNFIKCMFKQIDETKEKEELIDIIYIIRYYNNLYINDKKTIREEKELKKELDELQDYLISKAYKLKIFNTISEEKTTNALIIKNILESKIITLENISVELKQNEESIDINIYDGDIYEKNISVPKLQKKDFCVKFNKQIKIFN